MGKYITQKSKDYALVDKHTGELLDYNQTRKVSLDEFIMVFFASYPELMKLKGQQLKVLMACWKCSTFGNDTKSNVIVNNAVFKQQVREYEPVISDAAIDVAISHLAKKGLLRKMCRGQYELNPDYFFRGKLSDRSKLRLKVEVDPAKVVKQPVGKTKDGKVSFCFFTYAKSVEFVMVDNLMEDGQPQCPPHGKVE